MRLADRVAIVTGAAQGIGRAYALGLAAEGAKVVVADILEGTETVEAIREHGDSAIDIPTDVSDEASTRALAETTVQQFGRIDILVNNAAVFVNLYPLKDFDEIAVEEWDKVRQASLA